VGRGVLSGTYVEVTRVASVAAARDNGTSLQGGSGARSLCESCAVVQLCSCTTQVQNSKGKGGAQPRLL